MAVHRCSSLPSFSASISITASNLSQVNMAAAGLGCCQAHCDLCGRCFKRRGFGRHRCSEACPHPTLRARQQFQHVCLCSGRFRRSWDLVWERVPSFYPTSLRDHGTFVEVAQQDRTGVLAYVCVCVCVCARVCVCVYVYART